MNPLILEFAETPKAIDLDFSLIEYSKLKNLTVLKGTDIPAISYASMNTETFTKADQEPTDSDYDYKSKIKHLLDTRTDTFTSNEPSDSDANFTDLQLLMDTQTITESVEPTDADQ